MKIEVQKKKFNLFAYAFVSLSEIQLPYFTVIDVLNNSRIGDVDKLKADYLPYKVAI